MAGDWERPVHESDASLDGEFEFEIVAVDARGRISQQKRGRARQKVQRLTAGVRQPRWARGRADGASLTDPALEMVLVPDGSFLMGSRAGQGYEDERPQHSVIVPSFWLGKHPVMQEQWVAEMPWRPRYRCVGPRRPVDRVSWDDAREFCRCLARLTGATTGCRARRSGNTAAEREDFFGFRVALAAS